MTKDRMKRLADISDSILKNLERKNEEYADSWKIRGGVGAFMMLARKWDRIENTTELEAYDLFHVMMEDRNTIIDDVDDLIGYLLLCREEVNELRRAMRRGKERGLDVDVKEVLRANKSKKEKIQKIVDSGIPGPRYANQDPDLP
jgi:hypothetical protein